MELASSQSYANFRAWVPRNSLPIGLLHPHTWQFYDWGPRSYPEPVVCLHSIIGSAESFYHQLISLPPRGYRIISVQLPVYWTVAEFCDAFHTFVEVLGLKRFHLMGAGLGGFLAMQYSVRRPERVGSILLIHSFLSTTELNLRIPYSVSVLKWLPDFLIRLTIQALLPKGKTSLQLANAAEFAIGHTLQASRKHLASRLALSTTTSSVVGRLLIPESQVTLIDALDRSTAAIELSSTTAKQLPNAKHAFLNSGGDFPYISVPDEVNILITVHLRRHAPPPHEPTPVPPPARPRPLPRIAIKRRLKTEAVGKSEKQSSTEQEDAVTEAVKVAESARIERFSFETVRLREFLKDRNEGQLAAVMETCDGDVQLAMTNALKGLYDDAFFEQFEKENLVKIHEELESKAKENESEKKEDPTSDEQVEVDPLNTTYLLPQEREDDTGKDEVNNNELSPSKSDETRPSRAQSQLSNIDLDSSPMESKRRRYTPEYAHFVESGSKDFVGRGPAPYDMQVVREKDWNREMDRESKTSYELEKRRSDADGDLFSWQGVFPEIRGSEDDADGWEEFRQKSQVIVAEEIGESVDKKSENDEEEVVVETKSIIPLEAEESEGDDLRLREWSMSAQQATKQSR